MRAPNPRRHCFHEDVGDGAAIAPKYLNGGLVRHDLRRTYIIALSRTVDLREGVSTVKTLSILCVAVSIGLSMTAAFGRGGMASHPMSQVTGGAFGTSAAAPGTYSLGTALFSSRMGDHSMKGPRLGTSPAIDQEEAKVDMGAALHDAKGAVPDGV
jgi:hypothetical protein